MLKRWRNKTVWDFCDAIVISTLKEWRKDTKRRMRSDDKKYHQYDANDVVLLDALDKVLEYCSGEK
jgi:hypothetical protein